MASLRTHLTVVTLSLSPFVAAACGGTAGSDASTPAGTKLADVPTPLAKALCDLQKECSGPALDVFLAGQDCVQKTVASIEQGEFALLQSAIDAKRTTYDGTKFQACLDSVKAGGCDFLTHRLTTECDGLIKGTVSSGGDCTLNAECTTGLSCQAGSTCPGKCTALLGAGGTCTKNDSCNDGLVCSGATKTCIQPVGKDAPCGGATKDECAPGLSCMGSSATAAGSCKPPDSAFAAEEGATCDATADILCKVGLSCAVTAVTMGVVTWKCEKPATASACHVGFPETCPTGQYCALPTNSVDGTCQPLPGDGQACAGHSAADTSKTLCASTATCVSGTCKAIQNLGAACTTNAECVSEACGSGKCTPSPCGDVPSGTR